MMYVLISKSNKNSNLLETLPRNYAQVTDLVWFDPRKEPSKRCYVYEVNKINTVPSFAMADKSV